jgi:putative lipoprotein
VHEGTLPAGGAGSGDVVTGAIRFPEGTPAFVDATVRISLLDVTRADAPSRVVAEEAISHAIHPGGAGEGFAFALRAGAIDARGRYVIRVHVDVDGDGRVSQGDYVSMASYPVLTFGHATHVVVDVRRIGP